jgi:hypothetical protein
MDNKTEAILIVAVVGVLVLVTFILRSKNIRNIKAKFMGALFEGGTHEPDRLVVKDVEQTSEKGSNVATISSTNATVDGLKQTAQKDNVLDIGNR